MSSLVTLEAQTRTAGGRTNAAITVGVGAVAADDHLVISLEFANGSQGTISYLTTGEAKVFLQISLLGQMLRNKQSDEKVEKDCETDNEGIGQKRPGLDPHQTKLPPPKVDQGDEKIHHPCSVDPVGSDRLGMLGNLGRAAQKLGHSKADDDRH